MSLRGLRRHPAFARMEVPLAAFAIRTVLRLLAATLRWSRSGEAKLQQCHDQGEPVLLAFWHGRSALVPFAYGGRGICIMNSTHRDGEIVTRVLAPLGVQSTRGSSTRGGVGGMLGLVRANRRGLDVALIPDGPKGPPGVAKAGAAELALATGAPLFPVAIACSPCWRLRSWDRLMLPRPFARAVLVVGQPLSASDVAGVAGGRGAQREALRAMLQERLGQATAEADRLAGRRAGEAW